MTRVRGFEVKGEGAVILVTPACKDKEDGRLLLVTLVDAHVAKVLDGLRVDPPLLRVCSEELNV